MKCYFVSKKYIISREQNIILRELKKKMFWEEQDIADRLEFEVNSDLREQSNSL